MKKQQIFLICILIFSLKIWSQENLKDLINALPELKAGVYKGTFLNDSLVYEFLNEFVYEAEKRNLNLEPYIKDINWILIEPDPSDTPSQLTGMNLGKVDKERQMIILSRNCLLDRFILKATLYRELSHYLGIPYNTEGLHIMSTEKPKGYSYSWFDDYEIREHTYDDMFDELKKYLK